MSTATARFDVTEHLVDATTMANYLTDCLEEGGVALFLGAIGDVARANGMSTIATGAGLTRASLYKALGAGGNPALGTVVRVLDALGFSLSVSVKAPAPTRGAKATRRKAAPASAAATRRAPTAPKARAKALATRKPARKQAKSATAPAPRRKR